MVSARAMEIEIEQLIQMEVFDVIEQEKRMNVALPSGYFDKNAIQMASH